MSFKSRLLTTAFVLPVTGWLALTPSLAFDLTGADDDVTVTDTVTLSAPLDDDDNVITQAKSILIDGTPTTENAALLIDSGDADVVIDGVITIRNRDADGELVTLRDAYGVRITGADDGRSIRLKSGARIYIIEGVSLDNRRGPDYDADDDGFADNDSDEDGISEGSHALDGNNWRVGLWKIGEMSTDIIGEAGSSIVVYGNGVGSQHAAGVVISDANLDGNLDLSTSIEMYGDETRGVDILGQITGYYRQRGNIDVRGEDGIGINIGAAIGGSLMIEAGVNATGYSTITPGSTGGPTPGVDESDLTASQQTANQNERRQSRAAVEISADIQQGVIINGPVNGTRTAAETDAFTCREVDDDCSADGIIAQRNDGIDVTSLKTQPFHYDENRPGINFNFATASDAYLTSYGESEATLLISGSIGTEDSATREKLLDTTDDDDDDTADSPDDVADPYDSDAEFFFSHGLINRNWIEANGLYDSVDNGAGYSIIRPATALKLNADDATIHGGIFNSGVISAIARNANATAIDLVDGVLTDGLRGDNAVFLNEGLIQANIASDTRSHVNISSSSNIATAVKIGGSVDFEDRADNQLAAPVFINAGTVRATSTHTQLDADTEEADDYEGIAGLNARAFDFSDVTGDFNLVQRLRQEDTTLSANVDGVDGDETVYRGGGDLDMDANDDGVVDARDVPAPRIIGDVLFNDDDNDFTMTAGTVDGLIDFGGGTNNFTLGNSTDDTSDDYRTVFTGRISHDGTLDITAGRDDDDNAAEKTRLHFVGQEGVDLNGDGDDADTGEEFEGLDINNLDLNENAELRFSINPDFLDATTPLLNVTNFDIEDDVTISLDIARLLEGDQQIILLEAANDLIGYADGINNRRPEGQVYPFVYDVALAIDESNANDRLVANYALKDADALGLNANEEAAFDSVIKHFIGNERLENAITGITEQDDFKAAYRQLLPHYGDGMMKQLASLAQSATGAVSQHLQIANAGGRRGGDGWLQQFGDFRKRDSGAQINTLSGTSFGMALGFDMPAGAVDAVGAFAQMSFTAVNEKTSLVNEVKAENFSIGAYLADTIGPLRYELNAATGTVAFDGARVANFNGVNENVSAAWDGTTVSASARLAYPILDFRHLLRLEAGVDYFSLEQDAYKERTNYLTDPELAISLGKAESEALTNYIGLRGGLRAGGGSPSEIVWEPNYYLGYRTTADYSPYEATANFASAENDVPSFTLKATDELNDMAELGFGIAAHNDYFAFEFNYRGQFGDDTEVHGGGISIRLLF